MKKIYISIFIFLLLIGISSFSFATYVDWAHYDTYDSSNINFSAPTQQNFQDLINLSHTLITSWGYDQIVDFENCEILMYLDPNYYQGACIYLFFYNPSSVAYSRNNSSSIEFLINQTTPRPNFIFAFRFISNGYYLIPYSRL